LGEDTSEFGFAGFGGAVGLFALASDELFGAAGYAGAVVFDIEDRDGLERNGRLEGRNSFPDVGGETVDQAVVGALFELQSGEGVESFCTFVIGGAVCRCQTDEFGHSGGMVLNQIQAEVKRSAAVVTVRMVEVATLEDNRAEEGLHGDRATGVDDFSGQRRGVVGDELPVVEEFFDDAAGVAGEGVAQSRIPPRRKRIAR